MKKFYRFFSLLLLSIVGVATAAAQYNEEKMLTSMDEIVGQQVALFSNTTGSFTPGYLCGTEKSTTITEDALYEFVATGNTSSDGYDTYYLKQVSTGQYLKDFVESEHLEDPEPSLDASYAGYTSSVDAAMEFVVVPADDDESAAWGTGSQKADYSMIGRGSYSLDCQSFDEGAFCISRAAKYNAPAAGDDYNGTCMFLVGYSAYAPYPDTNLWCIYSVSAQDGYDKLTAYMESTFPESLASSGYYEGTAPGCIPSTEYAALQEAYQNAKDLYDNTGTSDECEAALAALQAAKAAADAAVITLTDGNYYFISNMRSNHYVYGQDGKMYPGAFTPPTDAASATAAAAKYMWKAISAGDGKFYFQNLYTGTYAGPNSSSDVSTTAPLTEQATIAFTLNFVKMNSAGTNGIFTIDYDYSGGSYEYNVTGYTSIVHWKDASDTGCQFSFTDATDMAAAVADQVAQQQLNDQLQAAYDDATELYNRGRVYTSAAAEASTDFSAVDGLVTTAEQLSTNAQESAEGDITNAVDGNWQTHFHSTYNSSSSDGGYHYIQANLGQQVQNLVIKMSKRYNNAANAPTSVRISGTNDVNGEWTIAGTYAFNYDQNLTYATTASDGTDSTAVVENYAGYLALELPAAYQYVRMEVITTTNGATAGDGHPFFTFGEIRYYGDAVYDATKSSSFEAVSEATAAELARQIAAARTELEAQGATQETIDALIAATKAFEAEYPDAAILEEAIEAAQSVSTACAEAIGTELGYYSQETYDALTAAIEAAQAAIPTDGSAMEVATIQAHVAALEAAIEALKASVVLPEAGKYYKLLGMTTDENNSRALNAIVYAKNNDINSSLLSQEQSETVVDAANALNYLWKLVSINGTKIVLQNVGTGFYMNEQSANGESVTLSPEAVELGIQGISTGGGFNIIVGEGEYLNFAGQRANMVSWTSASGTDNSSIKLVEVDESEFTGATTWPVTANVNQIITLPIAVLNPNDQGEVYTVLGEKETDGVYTLELQTLSDETIPAGTPFVFKPTESGVTEITLATDAASLGEIEYATMGETTENGTLTGVIVADTIMTDATVLLKNGAARILSATTEAADRVADANTGYITYLKTEETGDAQIALSESMITGIANATIVKTNAPVDVYTISGVRVKAGVKAGAASNGLPAGIYIIGGQKVLVK